MALSKSFFSLRRGSTKSMTYQVLGGSQVTKDRVAEVKNPRTTAQQRHRMCMATATAAYDALRDICNHSFEGVAYGKNSRSRFMSLNAKLLKANLAAAGADFSYNPYQDPAVRLGKYLVSSGTLPAEDGATFTLSFHGGNFGIGIDFPEEKGDMEVADFADALGLSLGDFITICLLYKSKSLSSCRFEFIRVRYEAYVEEVLTEDNFYDYYTVETSNPEVYLSKDLETFGLGVEIDAKSADDILFAFIRSKKSNGRWLRSTATLAPLGDFTPDPTAATALATYPVGKAYVLNGDGEPVSVEPALITSPSLPVNFGTTLKVKLANPITEDDLLSGLLQFKVKLVWEDDGSYSTLYYKPNTSDSGLVLNNELSSDLASITISNDGKTISITWFDEMPDYLTSVEIEDVYVGSEFGASVSVADSLPKTYSRGESVMVTLDKEVTFDQLLKGALTVFGRNARDEDNPEQYATVALLNDFNYCCYIMSGQNCFQIESYEGSKSTLELTCVNSSATLNSIQSGFLHDFYNSFG